MTNPIGQSQELHVLPTANELLKLGSRPAQVIEHPSWNEARDRVISLVTGSPSLIAVLGPPGSGKTTLLHDLGSKLGKLGYAARLLEFADNSLEVEPTEIVLIDEADRISSTWLEALCRGGAATIVLAALPAFAEHLEDHYPDVAIVPLTALPADEALAFLAERLAQFGLPMTCLTEAAWAQLIVHGNGVPRLLFALLKLTLLIAAEKHAERATGVHVKLAVEVRNGTAGGTEFEPTATNSDIAEPDAPGRIPGPAVSSDAGADAGKRTRHSSRGPVAGAVCLVAAAALLIWWQTNETASSGPNASPVSVGGIRAENADAAGALASTALRPSAPAGINESKAAVQATIAPVQSSMATTGTVRVPAATMSSNAAPSVAEVSHQPATAAAGTTQDLPANALVHVVLTYPRGDMAAAERAAELARVLRTGGLGVGDPFPVAPRTSKKSISYYFTQDASAATDIGQRLRGEYGEAKLVRLPRAAGQPRPGTIEIALGSE